MRNPKKLRKVILLDADVHAQIESYFENQGIKFNLSEAVRSVEIGLLNSLIKYENVSVLGEAAPPLRAQATAGLIIADAFQGLMSDIEKMK